MTHKYILLLSCIISVGLSSLFSVFSIGGYNQAEVSALLSTSFTPAGYTFAIWSIIYASWIILGVSSALGFTHVGKNSAYLLAAAQILSSLWLLPSQALYIGTSFIIIISVLYFLTLGFFTSRDENKYVRYVIELFFGWIIVASIANLHLMFVSYDIYFFPIAFTIISLILAILIFFISSFKYKTFIPSLVFIWSAVGIIIGQENILIILFSLLGICIILSSLFLTFRGDIQRYIAMKK